MKLQSTIGALLVGLMIGTGTAHALPLLEVDDAISLSDPTQLGRLSRDGVPSDWSVSKPFPGVLNTSTTYHYLAFMVNVGLTPFIQISVDMGSSINLFTSAYDTAYLPNSAGAETPDSQGIRSPAIRNSFRSWCRRITRCW
jgi:hypothetical protein